MQPGGLLAIGRFVDRRLGSTAIGPLRLRHWALGVLWSESDPSDLSPPPSVGGGLSPAELLEVDNAWHERLLATCHNRELLTTLTRHKNRLYRFEFGYMADAARGEASVADHRHILEALARGNREEAGEL